MIFQYRGEVLYFGDRGEAIGAHYDVDAESIEAARVMLEERLVHSPEATRHASWFRITRDGVEEVAYRLNDD